MYKSWLVTWNLVHTVFTGFVLAGPVDACASVVVVAYVVGL